MQVKTLSKLLGIKKIEKVLDISKRNKFIIGT